MPDDKPKHSPIGASSMSRWSSCPGSIKLSEGCENKSGIAAQEGTAAHEVIGLALDRAINSNTPTREILKGVFDAITVYSDFIEDLVKSINNAAVYVEHSFDMGHIYPNLYGTADCVVYDPQGKVLHVIDYKHGEGLPVEVDYNMQACYYALGAILTLKLQVKWVEIVIVQPRCYHPGGKIRKQRLPITYFIDFKADLIDYAKETEKKNATLKAGAHCLFCPAKQKCPAFAKGNVADAKKEFTFYKDPSKEFDAIGPNAKDAFSEFSQI